MGGAVTAGAGAELLALYDAALPQVYGYLLRRCGDRDVAEELTSETFLAATDAARRTDPPPLGVGWLIGVARHKLADHWRGRAREQRNLRAVATDPTVEPATVDPWDGRLDALQAWATLARLAPQHRAALTLRYVDDLPVPQVADLLGRTAPATEALLVRARREFRAVYDREEGSDD
ncbi:MAG: RNA polymerase sigma factor [Jatrophihabitantaceae bacterium]